MADQNGSPYAPLTREQELFKCLIAAATDIYQDGMSHVQTKHKQLIESNQARVELRIGFNPVPFVTGELIREYDGECIGHLFQHQARVAN